MNKNKKKTIGAGLFLTILCLSVGFALLNSNLDILGTITAKSNSWDVHFENVQVSSGSVTADTPSISNQTSVSYTVTLDKPGDSYDFTVDVVNKGSIDAMVNTITKTTLTTDQQKYIEHTVTYSNGSTIKQYDFLEATTGKKTIKVHVGYKDNLSASDLPSSDTQLSLSFTVEYVQADENVNNYAKLKAANCEYDEDEDNVVCASEYFRKDDYLHSIKTLTFEDEIDVPSDAVDYWDISKEQDESVMAYIALRDDYYYDLYIQSDKPLMANEDMSYWFYDLGNLDKLNNLYLLDTSNVTNMEGMFHSIGFQSASFTLDLGDNFNTSNVTDMSYMFWDAGGNSTVFKLDLGNNFDTSKVTNMEYMFYNTGYCSTVFTLNLGNNFDTSKVTNMESMFAFTGIESTSFTLNLGNKFDTSNVTKMDSMFEQTGYFSTQMNFSIDIKGLDKSYEGMFAETALNGSQITVNYTSATFDLVDAMIATKSDDSNVVKGTLLS